MGESIQPRMDGQGWFTYHLIKNLSRIKNIDLTVIGDEYLESMNIESEKLIHKKKRFTLQKLYFLDILRKINSEEFDIIHSPVNYGLPYFWFVDALKVKTIHDATGFEIDFDYPLLNKFELKTQFKIFGHSINKIATVSNTSKREIIKHFHLPAEKIKVIYNGVDKQFKHIDKDSCKKILDKYDISMPFIFHISKASSIKNIDGIIKAFHKIEDKTNCNLVIAGAWNGNTTSRITSAGYIPFVDLPYFYSGAEIFVFPSFHEGFGLPVLESMACGTPVITSNIYGTKEVALDSAVLVDPDNIDEIAEAMYNLLTDKEKYEEMRRKGAQRAKYFSWEKCAAEYVELYRELYSKKDKEKSITINGG